MHLQRVRIYGFKSFAQEVTVELTPGVTAIVGPNGGGKSNVVDAIRWALGEQRARELRVEHWSEILYGGAPGRSPARMAEVTLEFDNRDGQMAQWPEVLAVTRRYYRSGDSEYVINGRTVRLKDVADIFLDSGLGRAAYAIISQGRVDSVLLQRPEERLEQLQEAAGVARYKARKRETEIHLQDVQAKWLRLQDRLAEMRAQRDGLVEAAQRERQQGELIREKAALAQRIAWTEYLQARARLAQWDERIRRWQTRKARIDAQVGSLMRCVEALSRISQKAQVQYLDAQRRWEASAQALNQARVQKAQRESRRHGLEQEQERLEAVMQDLRQQLRQLDQDAVVQAQALKASEHQLRVLEAHWRAQAQAVEKWAHQRDQLHERWVRAQAEYDQVSRQIARWHEILGTSSETGLDCQAALSRQQQQLAEHRARQAELADRLRELGRRREELKQRRERYGREVQTLSGQVAGLKARLEALRHVQKEGAEFSAGVRAVLQAQQKGIISGILGTLGELTQADRALATALAVALGGAHQDIVVETERQARTAIHYLSAHRLGRATFLPLDTVLGWRPSASDAQAVRQAGVLGWMAELVQYPSNIEPAVFHVLGRVLCVQSLEVGREMGRRTRYRYKMVTVDGQIIHPGGALTGGSLTAPGVAAARRRREVQSLTDSLHGLTQALEQAQTAWAAVDPELGAVEAEWERVQSRLHDETLSVKSLQQSLDDAKRWGSLPETLARHARLAEERAEWMRERDQANARLQAEKAQAEAAQAQFYRQDAACRQLTADIRSQEQHRHRVADQLARHEATWQTVAQERAKALDQERLAEQTLVQLSQETAHLEHVRRQLAELASGLRAIAQQSQQHKDRWQTVGRQVDGALHQALRERDRIWGPYRERVPASAQEPLSEGELASARDRVLSLDHALTQLGPVEPGALAAWEKACQRCEQLDREIRDVQTARQALQETLEHLDDAMRQRVAEIGHAVEQAFQIACQKLYGGGTSGFSWVENGSGIDLWVHMPGKKPSRLSWLSGGEKALGAIAWLFALMTVRPAPFVVLDEVEASLDQVNASRYARYLDEVGRDSQFIVVTHHRETMEVARVLWGVASDGRGGSRLVSVRWDDLATVSQ